MCLLPMPTTAAATHSGWGINLGMGKGGRKFSKRESRGLMQQPYCVWQQDMPLQKEVSFALAGCGAAWQRRAAGGRQLGEE